MPNRQTIAGGGPQDFSPMPYLTILKPPFLLDLQITKQRMLELEETLTLGFTYNSK